MGKGGATFEVNRQFLGLANHEWVSRGEEWDFHCECSRANCHERVRLSIDAYIALHGKNRAVLAPGHRISRAEKASRRAIELRNESSALRAQAPSSG